MNIDRINTDFTIVAGSCGCCAETYERKGNEWSNWVYPDEPLRLEDIKHYRAFLVEQVRLANKILGEG